MLWDSQRAPRRRRCGQAIDEPVALVEAQRCAVRVEPLAVRSFGGIGLHYLGVAVLANVEHEHVEQVTPRKPTVGPGVGTVGRDDRKLLEPHLECSRQPLGGNALVDPIDELTVVEHGHRGNPGLQVLQPLVGLELGVHAAVVGHGESAAVAHIHVVTQMHPEVDVGLVGDGGVGHVQAPVAALLTARPGKHQLVGGGARGRGGAQPTGDGADVAGGEAVVVPTIGRQAGDCHLDGVSVDGQRPRRCRRATTSL